MDDAGYDKPANPPSDTYLARSRPSLDTGAVRSPRLQKQRSNGGMRSASHALPRSSAGQSVTATTGNGVATTAGAFGNGAKARKPSIRNAVRKIFGRRSREAVPQNPESTSTATPSAARHTHHKSEPTALVPPREEPEPFMQDADFIEQTMSDPYRTVPSPPFNRTASPYAVQFPYSARLKPLDLGNPFTNPSSQLRRRKTLPGMMEGEPLGATEGQTGEIVQPSTVEPVPEIQPILQRTTSQVKKTRRKSRSTDDLKSSNPADDHPLRKRSDEIRYWRESFQPDVLRASGFTTNTVGREENVSERRGTPQQRSPRPQRREVVQGLDGGTPTPAGAGVLSSGAVSRSGTLRSSPPFQPGYGLSVGEGDYRPSSGGGTEMSKDLEDRVAKLEAGLQNFQRSLQRLTAERNRRTVIMGGSIAPRRLSNDMRTPSLLAETLADPLEPSSYQYDYVRSVRPSTPPQPTREAAQPPASPIQNMLDDPFGPELATSSADEAQAEPTAESFPMTSPTPSHPPTQQQPPAPASSSSRSQPQPYTFSSLYQMLADERSARRKLESQLRSLQQDISDLHTQVASSSMVQSARSSYMIAGSSSRLQDLLRGTESSPPSASHQPQRDSGLSNRPPPAISRFSGSESEAGAVEHDEPHEAYQTPDEVRSPPTAHQQHRDDDDNNEETF